MIEELSVHTHELKDLTMLGELRMMPYRERVNKATIEQKLSHPDLFIEPKIYIASKAKHRPQWRDLRDSDGYNIISRWIDTEDKYSADPRGLDFTRLWQMCVEDVKNCDVLVLYVEIEEQLKGALVELGIALGLEKEIFTVGYLGDNGTWHNNDKIQVSDKSIHGMLAYIYGKES